MIALTTANTVVQPHSRVQSRALSITDVSGGEVSSSFDILILPFAHAALRTLALRQGARPILEAQAGAVRSPLTGMGTGRYC